MKKLIVQHRRGSAADWEASSVVPRDGELVVNTSTSPPIIKIGNGEDKFDDLKSITESVENDVDLVNSRVSELIEAGTPHANTWEAEVADIHVTRGGLTHITAGDAVRFVESKVDALSDDLNSFRNAEAVDGLHYADSKLYLKAGPKILYGSEVTIVSGGGGGGGSSISQVDLYPLPIDSPTDFSIVKSEERIYIKFMFTSVRNDRPTGNFTCQLFKGEYSPTASPVAEYTLRQEVDGSSLDVTDFLIPGQNILTIKCIDIYNNYIPLTYKINLIQLELKSSFNQYQVFDLNDETKQIRIEYTPNGSIQRTAYLRLYETTADGTKVLDADGKPKSQVLSSLTILKGDTQPKNFTIDKSKLVHGANLVGLRLEAQDETTGDLLVSKELFFDILANNSTKDTAPMIGSTLDYSEVAEGSLISIPYLIYHAEPQADASVVRTVSYFDGKTEVPYPSESVSRTDSLTTWTPSEYPSPSTLSLDADQVDAFFTIKYTSGSSVALKKHHIVVKKSDVALQPITDNLIVQLTADAKSNDLDDKEEWKYNDISTVFTDVNWVTNGWKNHYDAQNTTAVIDKSLRLSGPAKAAIGFDPFYDINLQDNGLTFEIDFSVSNVSDTDATFITCMSGDIGFEAKGNTARFKIPGASVSAYYKDGAKVKLTGVIEQLTGNKGQFMYLYIDGVMSNVVEVTASSAQHNKEAIVPISLGNSAGVLDVYSIRIYDRALSSSEVLQNYIADLPSVTDKTTIHRKNSIYEVDKESGAVSDTIDYEAVKGLIPTILLRGELPPKKGDERTMKMDFHNPSDVNKSFSNVFGGLIDVTVDVQGTSSAAYPRKNWKLKFKDEYKLVDNAPPAKVFCIKVDFAEGTGTHNTQNANLIETFYQDLNLNTLPPQVVDPTVRTTISGFPAALFVQEAVNSPIKFYAKCNFNFDKGAKNVFGFTSNYDVECWEFRNNKEICNFKHDFETDHYWLSDFEPRYTSYDFDTLEELEYQIELNRETSETAAKQEFDRKTAGLAETDPEYLRCKAEYDDLIATYRSHEYEKNLSSQYDELIELRTEMIARFKELFDWVMSTDPETVNKNAAGELDPIQFVDGDGNPSPITIGSSVYTHDSVEYRGHKFRAEFETYFDLNYSAIYYVYTFVALMIDQRAKNMFLTRWGNKWYPYFYDNDSCFGIDNSGNLDYDYYHEDTSIVGNETVFTGASSVLWNNFRKQFPGKIQEMYNLLRSKKMNLQDMLNQFITQGAKKWSQAIYNEDSQAKYLALADPSLPKDEYHPEYIYNVKGTGELQLEYFLDNRFAYCDSKWQNSKYEDDVLTLRPSSDDLIPSLTLIPSIDMYCGVEFGKGGTKVRKLLKAGQNTGNTFSETLTGDNVETNIWGVSRLSSLGDLSPLKTTQFYGSGAVRLTELILGNKDPSYSNPSLKELAVPASPLLKKLDITNCTGLGTGDKKDIDVRDSENIEEIYATGTSLEEIRLPQNGYLKTLHLPVSTKRLTLVDHPDLTIDNLNILSGDKITYTALEELNIVGCDKLSSSLNDIFHKALSNGTLSRIKLSPVTWNITNIEHLRKLYIPISEGGYGLGSWDDQGNTTSTMLNIEGVCNLRIYDESKDEPRQIPGHIMSEIRQHFPKLRFVLQEGCYVRSNVTFYEDDLKTIYYTETIDSYTADANSIEDPTLKNYAKPSRKSSVQYSYEFNGWSKDPDPDRHAQADALENILGDRALYPAFERTVRSYSIGFYTGSTLLYSKEFEYGTTPVFESRWSDPAYIDANNHPIKLNVDTPSAYEFIGWQPAPIPVTGSANYYAQFIFSSDSEWYQPPASDYSLTKIADNKLCITTYNNDFESIVRLPESITIEGGIVDAITGENIPEGIYTISEIRGDIDRNTGFSNNSIEIVDLNHNLEKITEFAFSEAPRLNSVYIHENVSLIHNGSFTNCPELSDIYYDAENAKIDTKPGDLNPSTGQIEESIHSPFMQSPLKNSYNVIIGPNVKTIPGYLFYNSAPNAKTPFIKSLTFETYENEDGFLIGCSTIGSSAFSSAGLTIFSIPDTVTRIGNATFQNNNFKKIILPEAGKLIIDNAAFTDNSQLESVFIPANVEFNGGVGVFLNCPKLKFDDNSARGRYSGSSGNLIDTSENKVISGTVAGANSIPENTRIIGNMAFANINYTNFNMQLPPNIKEIEANAFSGSTGLNSLVLNPGLTKIGQSAIASTNISELTIPSTVSQIATTGIFANSNLKSIYIEEASTELHLGHNVFQNNSTLKSVIIDHTNVRVTEVGAGENIRVELFAGCRSLEEIRVNWEYGKKLSNNGDFAPWGAQRPITVTYTDYKVTYNTDGTETKELYKRGKN